MGNIVTPEQGMLPLPATAGGLMSAYPWWLNAALAIWALLALLCCCWLLLLLLLMRLCCKRWRKKKYVENALKSHSYTEAVHGSGGAFAGKANHFASAPLPPLPHGYENNIFSEGHTYATSGAHLDNRAIDFSDDMDNDVGRIPIINTKSQSIPVITENIEHNITKNYVINEERNYLVKREPKVDMLSIAHDQQVQHLPGPTVTTINMAAERITDNTTWEQTKALASHQGFNNENQNQRASSKIVSNDPTVFHHDVHYKSQPSIFTHSPPTPVISRHEEPRSIVINEHRLAENVRFHAEDDHGSTTSEMSGHDSESIYETIRVLAPKKKTMVLLEDEDEYRTAGMDEVEIEIKDLVRLHNGSERMGNSQNDIFSSTMSASQRHITPGQSSSVSSSSTLNKLPPNHTQTVNHYGGGKTEETVTETIQTQQIQTTIQQLGQQIDNSAFFIPLTSSATFGSSQMVENGRISIPVTSSTTILHEETKALDDKSEQIN